MKLSSPTVQQTSLSNADTIHQRSSVNADSVSQRENLTGMPDALKSGIENLSGYSMDDVRVHYNSDKPLQLHAYAYAQGTDIHLAPGQERHLPHEAWHVVQQKQGKVKPTLQFKGTDVNDQSSLETEADLMGSKAQHYTGKERTLALGSLPGGSTVQRVINAKSLAEFVAEQQQLQKREKKLEKAVRKKPKGQQPEPVENLSLPQDPISSSSAKKKKRKKKSKKGKETDIQSEEKAPVTYTTLGFEHEFSQMSDGLLRGVSHVELAESDLKMPFTGLPFILETDAGNELELVSPPFLFETLPGIPIPDPEDVGKVDRMIEVALRQHVREDGTTQLGTFMQSFGNAVGFTFHWKANKKNKVQLEPKNMTFNTHTSIHKGLLLKGTQALNTTDLEHIHIGPSNKGASSNMTDKFSFTPEEAQQEGSQDGNVSGAVISQANFATDTRVVEMIRQLGTGSGDDSGTYLQELTEHFREKLLVEAFGNKRKGAEQLIREIRRVKDQLLALYNREGKSYDQGNRRHRFESAIERAIAELKQPHLDKSRSVQIAENVAEAIQTLVGHLKDEKHYTDMVIPDPTQEKQDHEEDTDQVKMQVYVQQLVHSVKTLPELGAGSPNLRIFLNIMARILAGQLAVPAQKKLRKAQQQRFSSSIFKKKMDVKNVGLEAGLTSHVKDLDQSWVKDNIINIGTGMLDAEDWKVVETLLQEGSAFRDSLKTEIPRPNRSRNDKDGKNQAILSGYALLLEKNIVDAINMILRYIGDKKLTTEQPDIDPVKPEKTPEFMGHDPNFISPRQDTFLDTEKVQMYHHWPSRRLHVVELRWKATEQLQRLKEFYNTGFAPQGGERKIHKPQGIHDRLWTEFLVALSEVDREEVDDKPYDYNNMYVGVSDQYKSSKAEKKENKQQQEEKRGFDPGEFNLLENDGGGDCLFYALAGKNLSPKQLLKMRAKIARQRRHLPEGNNNAHSVVMALYQSGVVDEEDLRTMMEGRHNIPNNVVEAMQRIPGIYAGDDELQQWCMKEGKSVLVVDMNGILTVFTAEGSQRIEYEPDEQTTTLLEQMEVADICLFKTPNHWRKILGHHSQNISGDQAQSSIEDK